MTDGIYMKKTFPVLALFFGITQPAFAETCRDHFIRIFAPDEKSQRSFRTYNTATINGKNEQKFNVFSIGKDHILSQALVPVAPWSLVYNKQMFISNDKGNSWTKIRDLPENEINETTIATKTAALAKIGNEICATEIHDGKETVTIQADLDTTPDAPFKTTVKFWIEKDTDNIVKSTTNTIMPGTNHLVTQIFESAPDLVLPTPE